MITDAAIRNLESFIREHGRHFAARQLDLPIISITDVKITRVEIDFEQHKAVMANFQATVDRTYSLNFAKAMSPIDGSMDHDGYSY